MHFSAFFVHLKTKIPILPISVTLINHVEVCTYFDVLFFAILFIYFADFTAAFKWIAKVAF